MIPVYGSDDAPVKSRVMGDIKLGNDRGLRLARQASRPPETSLDLPDTYFDSFWAGTFIPPVIWVSSAATA